MYAPKYSATKSAGLFRVKIPESGSLNKRKHRKTHRNATPFFRLRVEVGITGHVTFVLNDASDAVPVQTFALISKLAKFSE